MRFSFWIGNSHPTDEILRSGRRAAETGWDGLWFADHFMPFTGDADGPVHEVWSTLSALAVVTDGFTSPATGEGVRLGPLVCGNTYRHPAVLLKQAVTTDHLAKGRVVLGLGAGWQENEHIAYGLEFGSFTDRFERLEEALQVIRGLLGDAPFSFDGERYHTVEAPLSPAPVGRLPILLGGGGEKKTLRMVAQYADEWNVWGEPDLMAQKGAVLDQHCERLDRDPAAIERSAVALLFLTDSEADAAAIRERGLPRPSMVGTPAQLRDQMAAYAEAGVDEVIVPDFTLGEGAAKDEVLDRFLVEVAADFR